MSKVKITGSGGVISWERPIAPEAAERLRSRLIMDITYSIPDIPSSLTVFSRETNQSCFFDLGLGNFPIHALAQYSAAKLNVEVRRADEDFLNMKSF